VLVAASALMGFPAVAEAPAYVVLALHVILQAAQPCLDTGLGASGTWILRWLGFACIVTYALYVAGDVAAPARNEAAASLEAVKGFLLFLVFLAGVCGVYLSMVRGRGGPPAAAAAEEHPDGGELNAMASRLARVVVDSKVWNIHDFLLLISSH
jgi:hypothetical protein